MRGFLRTRVSIRPKFGARFVEYLNLRQITDGETAFFTIFDNCLTESTTADGNDDRALQQKVGDVGNHAQTALK